MRRPNRDWDFFPYEHVLDTMLHELCHNEYGPHNADFYKLLDEIRKECDELMAKGITGTRKGFDLLRRRLSGFSTQLPLSSLRQSALATVENRACNGALLPSGPNSVVIAISRLHSAQYRLLPWLLKGDYMMIPDVDPKPWRVRTILDLLLELLK